MKWRLIIWNSLDHFLSIKNSSISQVNILADLTEHTWFKILPMISETVNQEPNIRNVYIKHDPLTARGGALFAKEKLK